jgi:hypothetical protein
MSGTQNALLMPGMAVSAPANALAPPPPVAQRPDLSHLMRDPYPGELDYLKKNPRVGGMATEDGRIILNPYSSLQPHEKQAVAMNEAARLAMHGMAEPPQLTGPQGQYLSTVANGQPYGGGNPRAQRETIIGRLLSGDPSAGQVSPEQQAYAAEVARRIHALGGGK